MNRFAIVLTHNRPELLAQCVAAIGPQVDMVIVIDNASDPRAQVAHDPADSWASLLLYVPDQPPNLARFWNLGIETALRSADPAGKTYIAVLCDDAIVPADWFEAVTTAMAETGAVVGCGGAGRGLAVKTEPDRDLGGRMPGHAWVLDPASGVRGDESMLLWYCDTDIDWQARAAGGMVTVGGYPVPNALPSGFMVTHPELIPQTGQDGLAFAAKWGSRPW